MLKAYIITEFATKIFFYIKNNTVLCFATKNKYN